MHLGGKITPSRGTAGAKGLGQECAWCGGGSEEAREGRRETPGIHYLAGLVSSESPGDERMGVRRPVNSLKLSTVGSGPVCSFPRETAPLFSSCCHKGGY